jgi:putative peptidoglycan lipid II flippase
MMEKRTDTNQSFLLQKTIVISFANLLGTGLGLALDAAILMKLGLGAQTDAYFVAAVIPVAVFTVLSIQTTNVLQPLFIQTSAADGPAEAWRFLNRVLTFSVVALLALACLTFASAPVLVRLLAPGFDRDVANLSVALCRIMFFAVPIMCPAAILSAILNAHGSFFLPASLRGIENLIKLTMVLLLADRLGVVVLAYAYVGASIVVLAVASLFAGRRGFRFRIDVGFNSPAMKKLGKALIYPFLGNAAVTGMDIFQTFLSSFLASGSLSALKYASRIIDSISGLVVRGVVVVTLPEFSRRLARGDVAGMKTTLLDATKVLLLITLPVCGWLLIGTRPLISVLFEHGQFTPQNGHLLATLLLLMLPYVALSRLLSLVEATFFGVSETRIPFVNMLVLVAAYIGSGSALFMSLGVEGLAVARSASYGVAVLCICWLFWRRFGAVHVAPLAGYVGRLAIAIACMMILTILCDRFLGPIAGEGAAAKALSLGALALVAVVGFGGSCWALGLIRPKALFARRSA